MDQKELRKLIKRRHPDYDDMLPHWEFLEATYRGGRSWFKQNIFKYHKEGQTEFSDRLKRAYRFNHTREIVNLVNKYIYKGHVERSDDAPTQLEKFWEKATKDGKSIQELMKLVDIKSSTFGRVWIMTDSNADGSIRTVREQDKSGARVYAYVVPPQHVLDVGFDEFGEPLWVLIYELRRDDADPLNSDGSEYDSFRLWTREDWYLIRSKGRGPSPKVWLEDSGSHGLGVVPGFPVDHMSVSESPYHSPALINDIAYLDRAIANYLSNLDAIIQDQTFSQLAIPGEALGSETEAGKKLIEMGTRRIFTFDGEGGARPFYLSPDPKQAMLIITAIKQIINEIYHSVGMAGERTKQDNNAGIDNSSGVAKAFDFERVNSLLINKAATLAHAENKLADLVMKWHSADLKGKKLVTYPESFDVRGLFDEFDVSQRLALLNAPATVQREQMLNLVKKLFPKMTEKKLKEMEREINDWLEQEPFIDGLLNGQPERQANGDEANSGQENDQE